MRQAAAVLVFLLLAAGARAENHYIPVSGVVAGANNTLFRTDVRLFNPSSQHTVPVSLHFLPMGMEGSNISGTVVFLAPRQMAILNNIVENFFDLRAPAIGAIRIDSDNEADYSILADSRTYTDSPNPAVGGTYGQFVPALNVERARRRTVVLHVSHDSTLQRGSRANVGVMNPNLAGARVVPTLYRPGGTVMATAAPIDVLPMSMVQFPLEALFGPLNVPFGFIEFVATEPVFTWASMVDNRSGDQFYVAGVEDKAEVRPLPLP